MEVREGLTEKVVCEQRPDEEGASGGKLWGDSSWGTGSRDKGPEVEAHRTACSRHREGPGRCTTSPGSDEV